MNCIIVHGSADDEYDKLYNEHWIPWIKNKLSKKSIETFAPLMPEPWKPNYKSWKKEFDKFYVNKESVLIGHSAGCAFLVRWLGDTKKKVKELMLVAPWKIAYRKDGSDKEFYGYEIDSSVKLNVGKVIIFTSDNEEIDGKRSANIFQEALGGKIIELKNKGHYTLEDMGVEEFPELLKEVLK
ncbi:MAG: alpha/beta hydrolase [archaeon]